MISQDELGRTEVEIERKNKQIENDVNIIKEIDVKKIK